MANTIKRNKKILEYLTIQLGRLDITVIDFIDTYVVVNVSSSDLLQIKDNIYPVTPDLFNNDNILIEILKIIGVMEVSENKKEFENLIKKRKKKKELTDFDKILKGIMSVPNKDKK
jgi:hypothetical protein